MNMIKTKAVALLSLFKPTKWLLVQKRQWQAKKRHENFDTCSPDVIPVFNQAFEKTSHLKGDYYEFGLYKGYLFYKAQEIAKNTGALNEMNFYGFDSFAGLPEVESLDSGWKFKAGMYAYDLNRVRNALENKSVDWNKTFLIKGFYSDSLQDENLLSNFQFNKAKIVLIDCDLYESTKDVLTFIDKYLQNGTIVIMDDWNCFDANDNKGQRLALREFLDRSKKITFSHIGNYGWHGAYFCVGIQETD